MNSVTQYFSSRNFLGAGGFGPVYKGFLPNKLRPGLEAQHVAVKYLDQEGNQGHKEWMVSEIFHVWHQLNILDIKPHRQKRKN